METWTQTGSPRRSPCFQMARAGTVSRGMPDAVFGTRYCCCCTSDPGENEHGTLTLLDKPGGLTAVGQR